MSPVGPSTKKRRAVIIAAFVVMWLSSMLAAYLSAQVAVKNAQGDLENVSVASAQRSRDASVAGCERTKADRMDSITGWQTARKARRLTARNPALDPKERVAAGAAAAVYTEVIRGFRSRIVDCGVAFPPVNTAAIRQFIREQAK